MRWRSEGIESVTWRCARWAPTGDVIRGKGRHFAFDEVFFTAGTGTGGKSLSHQEPVRRDAERGVMVESSPTSAFVVAQAEFLLEILVVALDAPAQMRGANQVIDCAVLGQRG